MPDPCEMCGKAPGEGAPSYCSDCITRILKTPNAEAAGLTKREQFAALAMQGLLAQPPHMADFQLIATMAVSAADALLLALSEAGHG
jgi:hypothetical protein